MLPLTLPLEVPEGPRLGASLAPQETRSGAGREWDTRAALTDQS